MEAYAAQVSDVAASVDAFMSDAISDQTARETLAKEFPDQAALGLRKLEPDLRHVVVATRRRLARNRQQTLATSVLIGINRIVVTDGKITPRIKFDLVRR